MIVAALLVMFGNGGCTVAPRATVAPTGIRLESPCTDSLYVALMNRPIGSLSDTERNILMERDKACAEYQQAHGGTGARTGGGPHRGAGRLVTLGLGAALGVVIALLVVGS
jgi:hypothetical protein